MLTKDQKKRYTKHNHCNRTTSHTKAQPLQQNYVLTISDTPWLQDELIKSVLHRSHVMTTTKQAMEQGSVGLLTTQPGSGCNNQLKTDYHSRSNQPRRQMTQSYYLLLVTNSKALAIIINTYPNTDYWFRWPSFNLTTEFYQPRQKDISMAKPS